VAANLTVQLHNSQGLYEQKDDVLDVYREAYAARLNDPFFYPDRFWQRLEGYASREGFRLVTGRVNGELVGFTLGGTLSPNTSWWNNLKSNVDADFLHETGSRTFGINELMVRPARRRRGFAKVMSDALLEGLPVERASLLVRADNIAAYTAYKSWGFYVIGQMQPFIDSPVYEVMVKELGESA
jgi:ribosomal protein S18 acetylase RimI-like enzyme